MVKILQKDEKLLREISKEVPKGDINSPRIKKIIKDMKDALAKEDDGVAIAAPQIGELVRIFVVSHKVYEMLESDNDENIDMHEDVVFINPEIINVSKKKVEVEEGCLSVRYFYGNIKRSEKVKVRALDENGEPFERGGGQFLSQIFQHEVDHLNGILFIDNATDIKDLPPEEIERIKGDK